MKIFKIFILPAILGLGITQMSFSSDPVDCDQILLDCVAGNPFSPEDQWEWYGAYNLGCANSHQACQDLPGESN